MASYKDRTNCDWCGDHFPARMGSVAYGDTWLCLAKCALIKAEKDIHKGHVGQMNMGI